MLSYMGKMKNLLFFHFSIFDKDDDGYIPVQEMRQILQSLGDKKTDQELDEMMETADSDHDGFINYEGQKNSRFLLNTISFKALSIIL